MWPKMAELINKLNIETVVRELLEYLVRQGATKRTSPSPRILPRIHLWVELVNSSGRACFVGLCVCV